VRQLGDVRSNPSRFFAVPSLTEAESIGAVAALLERDRETNHLIAGLQRMLTPLLIRSEETHSEPNSDAH
jgi:hypothetical protein